MLFFPRVNTLNLVLSVFSAFVIASTSPLAAGGDELINRVLPEANGPLDNPLKGWCPYTDAGDITQPYSMVFRYVSWKELEPREGDYQFAKWEKTWDDKLGRGKHVVFRVYVDTPSKPSGLPTWLRQQGVKETPYKDHGGGQSPDYENPRLKRAMVRFIQALGQRYNAHPRVAFIQLGLLGHWGEWHTWPREELYASPATEQLVIDAFHKAFPDKQLMARYGRDYAGKQPWLGFHDDMFPQDTDNGKDWAFLAGLRRTGRADNWKRAVVGGEMVPLQAGRYLGKDFDETLTMLERAHFSWVGPYCPALETKASPEFKARSQQLVRKMGYEYRLSKLTHPVSVARSAACEVRLQGVNQGVAPFYYRWPIVWALIDASGKVVAEQSTSWDLRTWQPGRFKESATLKWEVPAGRYRLAVGVKDPWTKQPAIRFANDVSIQDRWSVLSTLTVTE